jgi:hypothetical protein
MNENDKKVELPIAEYHELVEAWIKLGLIRNLIESCVDLNYDKTSIRFDTSRELEILLNTMFKDIVDKKARELKPQIVKEGE